MFAPFPFSAAALIRGGALIAATLGFLGCASSESPAWTPQVPVYELKDVSLAPSPVHRSPPQYPADLRRNGVQGSAQIVLTVTETGEVTDAHVVSATHAKFGAAALEAVRQWRFRPAIAEGKPVFCRMTVPIMFNLGEGQGR